MYHEEFHREDDCGDDEDEMDEWIKLWKEFYYEIAWSGLNNCRFNNMDY